MADLSDLPTTYHIDFDPQGTHLIDAGLDQMRIKELPTLTLGAWPDNQLQTSIDLRLKEIPDTRAHLPAHFEVGFCILGFKLFSISLCGEAQLITEPYVPHRMELCP